MEYKTYPCEVKFKYLVRRGLPVVAGFFSEKDALDYALSIGGAVRERISQGVPVRRIAEEFRCSVGYVQKLKCEHPL